MDEIGEYETKLHSDKLGQRFQVYLPSYESFINILVCNVTTVILPLKDCCSANFNCVYST